MSLYLKSEEDTMKNEIPAAISLYIPLQFFNYKTVDRILDIVSVIYLRT